MARWNEVERVHFSREVERNLLNYANYGDFAKKFFNLKDSYILYEYTDSFDLNKYPCGAG